MIVKHSNSLLVLILCTGITTCIGFTCAKFRVSSFSSIITNQQQTQRNCNLYRSRELKSNSVRLFGVLSKEAILRATANRTKKNQTGGRKQKIKTKPLLSDQDKGHSTNTPRITLDYVSGAVREAMFRQERILIALSERESKNDLIVAKDSHLSEGSSNKIKNTSLLARRDNIKTLLKELQILEKEVNELYRIKELFPSKPRKNRIIKVHETLQKLGFETILQRNPSDWSSQKEQRKEFGRPRGFDGLVYTSPGGVPILVGREGSHSDEALRRSSQGADLWFQIDDYNGSRVLLRTSLCKGMKGSKQCIQMAADVAAYFSHKRGDKNIRVMYTDSKHVAKRGSKVGQMRQSKSLGYIIGHPESVRHIIVKQ